ncbi:MAG: glycosyltransferase, partial [Aestuariivirgaceae bacterium]
MQIAFYSTMKPPDHPTPSGDRTMANLLLAAIREAGHTVSVASKLRSYSKVPDIDNLRAAADDEVRRLLSLWATSGVSERPGLWFTYHPYYKAPDLVGPAVAGLLGVPYVTAEASYSSRRQADEWADMQTPVVEAVRQACVNFCLTPIDREGLGAIAAPGALADLPAFLDTSRFCDVPAARTRHLPCRLLTVAMMRPGVKVQSYGMLAAALNALGTADWHLTVIGDGPARTEVHKLFGALPQERISWLGEQPGDRVRDELQQADVFVWPGFGEAYGLA